MCAYVDRTHNSNIRTSWQTLLLPLGKIVYNFCNSTIAITSLFCIYFIIIKRDTHSFSVVSKLYSYCFTLKVFNETIHRKVSAQTHIQNMTFVIVNIFHGHTISVSLSNHK